MMTELQYFCN